MAIQSFTVPWARVWAVQANEQMDKRVAQYCSLVSWLFWPSVQWHHSSFVACHSYGVVMKNEFFFYFLQKWHFFLIVVTHHLSFRWSQHKKVKEISFFVFMSTQSEWRATKDEWCHWKKKSFLQKVKKNFVFHDHSIWVTSDERQMTSLHCGPE